MTRFPFVVALAYCIHCSSALFQDDAGVLDFQFSTTGHGVTRFVYSDVSSDTVITSDSPISPHLLLTSSVEETSCFIASRKASSGALLWRRNVCSNKGSAKGHVVTASKGGDSLFSVDLQGVVRSWSMIGGQLEWDALTEATSQPRVLTFMLTASDGLKEFIAVLSDDVLVFLDAMTGKTVSEKIHTGSTGKYWLHGAISTDATNKVHMLMGSVDDDVAMDMAILDLVLQEDTVIALAAPHPIETASPVKVSSLQILKTGHVVAMSSFDKTVIQFPLTPEAKVKPSWVNMDVLSPVPAETSDGMMHVGDEEKHVHLVRLGNGGKWVPYGSEPRYYNAVTHCPAKIVVALDTHNQLEVWNADTSSQEPPHLHPMTVFGASKVGDDTVTALTAVNCGTSSRKPASFLLAMASGSTALLTLEFSSETAVESKISWIAEDGLATVSSAVILDASHQLPAIVDESEEEETIKAARQLELLPRLKAQWNDFVSVTGATTNRDRIFGFVKVALLLSNSVHKLWAVDTAGSNRGSIMWSIDLPRNARWHKMIHGTTNSVKGTHGINGGTNSRDILVVSPTEENSVEWTCVDGTHGDVQSQGSITGVASPVVQIVPFVGTSASCRQHAMLVHEDRSLSFVPHNDESVVASAKNLVDASSNGLFAHAINVENSRLEALQIVPSGKDALLGARLIGQTSFPGENIVGIAYPTRSEVVQSPCTILGDDSLLLKYINPHMAVIATMRALEESDPFSTFLYAKTAGSGSKRKPVGATASEEPEEVKSSPNLFINLVDTVSGRVLYRISHANVAETGKVSLVVSENWILYSFQNIKSRKTELGVLTLYEGMIHSKGLTAFTSPVQTTSFSSLDAQESKPVVIAKTYSLPKSVATLGITSTRAGISSRLALIATADDKIFAISTKMLEPRRPLGDVKETEKLEGLHQYSELIPLISFQALSYNVTVDSPSTIISSPTELESQSFVLAFGGPDVFFTRTSPSRGFDLLPESFNKLFLSLLVVGLLIVLVVMRQMASTKIVKQGWK